MLRMLSLLLVLIMLGGCAAPAGRSAPDLPRYQGSFAVGPHRVPLPEGEWQLVAHHVYSNRDGQPFADIQLVRLDEQQHTLVGGVLISANLDARAGQDEPQTLFCEQSAAYYKQVVSNQRGRDQDCWVISYFRAAAGRDTDRVSAQTLAYLYRHRIKKPSFAVYTAYRLLSATDNLTVQYYFNPEYHTQIEPAPRVAWGASPWHRERIVQDPRKVAYIEGLKQWSGEWYEQVKLGFASN